MSTWLRGEEGGSVIILWTTERELIYFAIFCVSTSFMDSLNFQILMRNIMKLNTYGMSSYIIKNWSCLVVVNK